MGHCCILGCKSRSERKFENITFHSFPQDLDQRELWVAVTGRHNWQPAKSSKICSLHFDKRAIIKKNRRKTLKPYTVPNINVHNQFDDIELKSEIESMSDPLELRDDQNNESFEEKNETKTEIDSSSDTLDCPDIDYFESYDEESFQPKTVESPSKTEECSAKSPVESRVNWTVGPKMHIVISPNLQQCSVNPPIESSVDSTIVSQTEERQSSRRKDFKKCTNSATRSSRTLVHSHNDDASKQIQRMSAEITKLNLKFKETHKKLRAVRESRKRFQKANIKLKDIIRELKNKLARHEMEKANAERNEISLNMPLSKESLETIINDENNKENNLDDQLQSKVLILLVD